VENCYKPISGLNTEKEKKKMIPRESSGNLPLTYDENELSPSNLSNATLEDVDEENTNDAETDINCSIREPEANNNHQFL
jgi:hypothetical protein